MKAIKIGDITPNYFGTDTREVGHYLREITEYGIGYQKQLGLKYLPFDPYDYPEPGFKYGFYKKGGYSILAFLGSAKDTRPGCHSVFFFPGDLTTDQIINKIKSMPCAIEIISKIPNAQDFIKTITQQP